MLASSGIRSSKSLFAMSLDDAMYEKRSEMLGQWSAVATYGGTPAGQRW
jgi:hypothetical protein